MSYNVNATFSESQVKIEGSRSVEMYVLNASLTGTDYLYYVSNNQDTYGWEMNSAGNLTATETIYTALPITADSGKSNLSGEISNLKITIPNTDRVMEGIIQNYDYLRGREVYQINTFTRNLPDGNTGSYLGVSGQNDHHAVLKEKMFVDSTTSNEQAVTFSCKPKMVIKNVVLPGRLYTRECQWTYLGTECTNVGSSLLASECPLTLDGCLLRSNSSRFGGFPSVPRKYIYI